MMDNREAAEMMRCPPTEDDQIVRDEVEIQISRGSAISVSDSPSSSSYARSDHHVPINPPTTEIEIGKKLVAELRTIACTCCGHHIPLHHHQADILNDFPEMPAGVKFDPSDIEILDHLEAKVQSDSRKLHPLIDEFIRTLEGDNGICYTHPENLPGVSKDGLIRHFFHRPSKAYTTGTRKRRKVQTEEDDGSGSTGETRWHKTGKTRAVVANGIVKGFKKILVLYTNYGRQRKPEKTNWVMHQYHLGHSEEEKDGELVLSKVFYQTQARHSVHLQPMPNEPVSVPLLEYPQHQLQVGSSSTHVVRNVNDMTVDQYYHLQQQQPRLISFGERDQGRGMSVVPHSIPMQKLGDYDDRDKSKEQFEADRRANNN